VDGPWPNKPDRELNSHVPSVSDGSNMHTVIKQTFSKEEITQALKPNNKLPARRPKPHVASTATTNRELRERSTLRQPANLLKDYVLQIVNLPNKFIIDHSIISAIKSFDPGISSWRREGQIRGSYSLWPREQICKTSLVLDMLAGDLEYIPDYCNRIVYEDSDIFISPHSKAHTISADLHMGMG